MGYQYGSLKTEDMVLGTEGHEKLTKDFIKVNIKKAWKHIYTRETCWVAEFLLIAKYKGIYLAGKPDILCFVNSTPSMIFEFKFSMG